MYTIFQGKNLHNLIWKDPITGTKNLLEFVNFSFKNDADTSKMALTAISVTLKFVLARQSKESVEIRTNVPNSITLNFAQNQPRELNVTISDVIIIISQKQPQIMILTSKGSKYASKIGQKGQLKSLN